MSRTTVLAATALVVALFAVLTSFFAIAAPGVPTGEQRLAEATGRAVGAEGELLTRMIQNQRYVEKAWLAAEAGNWPLAAFYAHALEENAERIVDNRHVEGGVDLSAIAAEVALPRAQRLLASAEAGDADGFRSSFATLVEGCNSCHKRSGHRYIAIQTPDADAYPSQDFAPQGGRSGT